MQTSHPYPIVVFDGFCGLCHRAVRFIAKRDHKARFRFVTNQSEYGQELLHAFGRLEEAGDSTWLIDHGKIYKGSSAALRINKYLVMPWPIFTVLLIIPAFLRDPFYYLIGRWRYRLFGRKDVCSLPEGIDRSRYLDVAESPKAEVV